MFDPAAFLKNLNRCAVMGIVNVTGDSFSEGPSSAPESAVRRALALFEAGADILDLGAESTRPGSFEVTPAEECRRLLPVLRELKQILPDAVISVDTRHGETAAAALAEGGHIINDVSMGRDPELIKAAAEHQSTLVLCHSRGTPQDMNSPRYTSYPAGVRQTVEKELKEAAANAIKQGVAKEKIWLDPGIGFAKNADQCHTLVSEVSLFSREFPWLWGISRKSFMGGTPESRGAMTAELEGQLISGGASVIRTHDAAALRHLISTQNRSA